MTTHREIIERIRELGPIVSESRRQALNAANHLAAAGDLTGATAAVDAVEQTLHPALAAGGGGGAVPDQRFILYGQQTNVPDQGGDDLPLQLFDDAPDMIGAPPVHIDGDDSTRLVFDEEAIWTATFKLRWQADDVPPDNLASMEFDPRPQLQQPSFDANGLEWRSPLTVDSQRFMTYMPFCWRVFPEDSIGWLMIMDNGGLIPFSSFLTGYFVRLG